MKLPKKTFLIFALLFLVVITSNAQEKVVHGKSISIPSTAQKKTVYGKVVAFYKFPIEYAEISVDNELLTTITDSLGNFSIECKVKDKLLFKAKGFKPVHVKVKNHTDSIKVSLIFEGMEKEVTHSTGFREIKGDQSSYNITHIDPETPNNSNYTNIIDLIRAGDPHIQWRKGNLYVRTITTVSELSFSKGALIIVDGMPMYTEDIEDIPVYNVKSVDVLKGTAAAIYGSRALHGVIVINLKNNLP